MSTRLLYQILIFSLVLGLAPVSPTFAETPNVTFRVSNSAGSLVSDAIVKVYKDWQRTTFADDLSRSGMDDAQANTVDGEISFAFAPGSYEYIVEKISSNSIYGTLVVGTGSQTLNLTLTTAGASVIAPHRSVFTTDVTSVPGDGTSLVTMDILLRTNDNTGLNGYSVTMASNRGSVDTWNANPQQTANSGRAQFKLSSAVPGKTKIYAMVGTTRLSTNQEITFTGEASPSREKSSLSLASSTITANTSTTLTVTVKSLANDPLFGRTVSVTSSRNDDVISATNATTDADGKASFSITPKMAGTSALTAESGGITLGSINLTANAEAPVAPPLPTGVNVGDLVKSAENQAVYYVGRDGKRHAFPNEKTYFTWFADFSSVKTISGSDLASLALGKNVTYKPGARMIKLQTVPKVYAVARGSVLRWIQTEAVAQSLYGMDWNTKIDDLSDAFFTNYTEGANISLASDFSPTSESTGATIDDQLGL